MQSRRHLGVAAVAVAAQLVSLAVATDLLGADVSDYATQFETIEAVGIEPDVGPAPPGIEPDRDPSPIDRGDADTVDLAATAADAADQTEDILAGGPLTPDQPAVEPDVDSESALDAVQPPAPTADAPTPQASTPTTPMAQRSSNPSASTPSSAPGTSTRPSEATPLTELAETQVRPQAAGRAGATATITATSTASSTKSSTATSTTPTSRPQPTVAPVAIDADDRSTARPGATTTWLPATTDRPITTWAATTTTVAETTRPAQAATTRQSALSASTTNPPTTAVSTTKPSTTKPSTTAPPATAPPTSQKPSSGSSNNAGLAAMSNTDPRFTRYTAVPSNSLSLGQLTEPAPVKDNGTVGDGQFRAACQYSHFAYDDPIVYPGQSGRSHLHMFFGNTETDAFSTTESIVNSGGGSCNGFELNRSAYWTPALLDGQGNAIVPDMIILYYKTKQPGQVQRMPQGLKMVSGNTSAESFTVSDFLYWSCGDSGHSYNKSNRIPDCKGDTVNATISFPQCWDGRNMDSADHRSHMALVSPHKPCPSTHPVRLPQISILLYFPGQPSSKGWHLSSDRSGGFNTGPGATLHADWWGGWNDQAMDLWTNGCMKAARNCSFGQTGTDRQLAKLNNFQNYQGPNVVPLP